MSAIYPLIHERLPFSQYLGLPGESSTALRRVLKSPKEYDYWKRNERADTPSLVLGRATHTAVLEMSQFLREYVLQPEEIKVRRGAAWDKFEAENAGKTILKDDKYTEALAIAEAIRSHPVAGPLFFGDGRNELTIQHRHASGALCKARIDRLTDDALIDVKTAHDITPDAFDRASWKYGYHIQAAYYRDAVRAAGLGDKRVLLVVASSKQPYDVIVRELDLQMLDAGRNEYERALATVAECTKAGKWPGVAPREIVPLRIPAWAAPEFNEEEAIAWGNEEVIQ